MSHIIVKTGSSNNMRWKKTFINNIQKGDWAYFDKADKIISTEIYKLDPVKSHAYYSNGNIAATAQYNKRTNVFELTVFKPDKSLLYHYSRAVNFGQYELRRTWSMTGHLLSESPGYIVMRDGNPTFIKKCGIFRTWTESGDLQSEEFISDVLIFSRTWDSDGQCTYLFTVNNVVPQSPTERTKDVQFITWGKKKYYISDNTHYVIDGDYLKECNGNNIVYINAQHHISARTDMGMLSIYQMLYGKMRHVVSTINHKCDVPLTYNTTIEQDNMKYIDQWGDNSPKKKNSNKVVIIPQCTYVKTPLFNAYFTYLLNKKVFKKTANSYKLINSTSYINGVPHGTTLIHDINGGISNTEYLYGAIKSSKYISDDVKSHYTYNTQGKTGVVCKYKDNAIIYKETTTDNVITEILEYENGTNLKKMVTLIDKVHTVTNYKNNNAIDRIVTIGNILHRKSTFNNIGEEIVKYQYDPMSNLCI